MRAWALIVLMMVVAPVVARAQARLSAGYALSTYLEEGPGTVPVGAYLSAAMAGAPLSPEVEVGYSRYSETNGGRETARSTWTLVMGPHFEFGGLPADPFLHVLGGVRVDSLARHRNSSLGGMAGVGADVRLGSGVWGRMGVDFQFFSDHGENVKTLRLNAGVSF